MEDKDIKEELSRSFLNILASYEGIKASSGGRDYGVDVNIRQVRVHIDDAGKKSLLDDGRYIDIQIKSTTAKSIKDIGTVIKYSIKGKNYNDLVNRRNDGNTPLILVLFILPDDKTNWINIDLTKLLVNGSSFWYRPKMGEVLIDKNSTKTIEIPKANQIVMGFFKDAFSNSSIWS